MSDGVHVYDFVVKHQSHNQASHGKGGKGSGGGAGDSSEKELSEAREDLQNQADGAQAARGRPSGVWTEGQAKMRDERLQGTRDGLLQAKHYVGAPDKMEGLKRIYPKSGSETSYASGFADAIHSAVNQYGSLKDPGYNG